MNNKQKGIMASSVLTALAGLLSAVTIVGAEARLPVMLTIFFTGFASGAALVKLLSELKAEKENIHPAEETE